MACRSRFWIGVQQMPQHRGHHRAGRAGSRRRGSDREGREPGEVRCYGVHATSAVVIDGGVVHSRRLPTHEAAQAWLKPVTIGFLNHPTRYLFFTGKGGVGETSLSTAAALTLADKGKRVLLVSTDAASNLDEMLGIELRNTPVPVPGAPCQSVLNIDPDIADESYRERVLAQMGAGASAEEHATVREQLSGACTTEIASFDEFSSLLSDGTTTYDHIVFDAAPTGHTLRLLSLPKAWTGFLGGNDRGASCLGPHSGLKMQEVRFKDAGLFERSFEDHGDPGGAARQGRHRRTHLPHWFAIDGSTVSLDALSAATRLPPIDLTAMAPPSCRPRWPEELGACVSCLADASDAADALVNRSPGIGPG